MLAGNSLIANQKRELTDSQKRKITFPLASDYASFSKLDGARRIWSTPAEFQHRPLP